MILFLIFFFLYHDYSFLFKGRQVHNSRMNGSEVDLHLTKSDCLVKVLH